MQNLSDDELDKLFQSAAEQYHAPGVGEGWRAMEKKLEAAAVRAPWWKFTPWKGAVIIGSAVVITSVSVWLMNTREVSGPTEKPATESVPLVNSERAANPEESAQASAETTNQNINQADQPVERASRSATSNAPGSSSPAQHRVASKGGDQVNNPLTHHPVTHHNVSAPAANASSSLRSSPKAPAESTSAQEDARSTQADEVRVAEEVTIASPNREEDNHARAGSEGFQKTTDKPATPVPATDSLNQPTEEAAVVKKTEEQEQKEMSEEDNALARWSLKISASPDFSTVKFNGPYGSGSNYAVQVQVQLSEKLALSTGAIWSKKVYSAKNLEYSTSNGNVFTADRASGDCDIIDVPVNLYYQLYRSNTFSGHAGLGISSYFMLNEKYVYEYDGPYSTQQYSTEVQNKNQEWAQVLNISVVVEKRLSARWALQVEPFAKLPVGNIGEGKLRLSTLGTFLTLRYTFKKPSN